jgi:CO/xanthine dehydrogenase FAD-binding subunit
MAISICSAALLAEWEGAKCRKVRIGLGAVAPVAMRARETEKILEGGDWGAGLLEAACARAAQEISPISDIRATADYRRSMAAVLLRRLCEQVSRGEK